MNYNGFKIWLGKPVSQLPYGQLPFSHESISIYPDFLFYMFIRVMIIILSFSSFMKYPYQDCLFN